MRRWRLKAVNREQLGIFMISFSKFIDSGGQLSAVVSPGSTNQPPTMVNPEGSSAPVVFWKLSPPVCQSSKQQTTIGSLIIEVSVIIVMGGRSLNFGNGDGCNDSDG